MSEKGDDLRYFGEAAEGGDGALFIVGRMSRRLEGAQGGAGDLEDGGGEGRDQQSHVQLGGARTHEYASGLSAGLGYLVGEHVRLRRWLTREWALEPRPGEFPKRLDSHSRAVIFVGRVLDLVNAERRLIEAAEEAVSNTRGQRGVVASGAGTSAGTGVHAPAVRVLGEKIQHPLVVEFWEFLVPRIEVEFSLPSQGRRCRVVFDNFVASLTPVVFRAR